MLRNYKLEINYRSKVAMGETLELLMDQKIVLDLNIITHKKLQDVIKSNVSHNYY